MTTNKVSSESPFYFQLIHVNNIWTIKTVFMQNGYRLQWYGIFPLFLIQYLAQLGLLVKVKVTVTRKWYATLRHPQMTPHTKFGIPTSKNIGDMDRTRKRDGRTDGRTDSAITICLPKFLWGYKKAHQVPDDGKSIFKLVLEYK